tara:strand:+ start:754 stop:987 length:234 start_codon:yes stop_codon:yes gene_type:complete
VDGAIARGTHRLGAVHSIIARVAEAVRKFLVDIMAADAVATAVLNGAAPGARWPEEVLVAHAMRRHRAAEHLCKRNY